MTDTTTHDLALARAERDAWQSTCEELHRTIAGRDVEIEAHLGRIDAADQRARSLDAALTAERDVSAGLLVRNRALDEQLAAIRDRLATIAGELFGPFPVQSADEDLTAIERGAYDGIRAAQELAAIRDLVAPGNPQGTVVDAVRATMHALGLVREDRDRANALVADRTAACDRADAEIAKLRAELAELRARPVLTVEALAAAISTSHDVTIDESELRAKSILAALGPVTLPSPDRAEELVTAMYHARAARLVKHYQPRPATRSDLHEIYGVGVIGDANVALAKLSPAPAREVAPARESTAMEFVAVGDARTISRGYMSPMIAVHADGGACHGTQLVDSRCPKIERAATWIELGELGATPDAAALVATLRGFTRAPRVATVGELLATAPVGAIVECQVMRAFRQVRADRAWFEQRWSASDGSWSDWYSLSYQIGQAAFRLPARLVPADQADADPSTRGPIGEG